VRRSFADFQTKKKALRTYIEESTNKVCVAICESDIWNQTQTCLLKFSAEEIFNLALRKARATVNITGRREY
jgi:hypothetical protein